LDAWNKHPGNGEAFLRGALRKGVRRWFLFRCPPGGKNMKMNEIKKKAKTLGVKVMPTTRKPDRIDSEGGRKF
jgi:hypothetical protein